MYIIIMNLIYIGILFIVILFIQIYNIIKEKDKIIKETFDAITNKEDNEEFIKDRMKFYNKSLENSNKQLKVNKILKEISNEDFNDFIKLDQNDVLVKYENNDKYSEKTIEGYDNRVIKNNIETIDTCRALTKCEQLDTVEGRKCGYCGTTDKFDMKHDLFNPDGSGPGPNVCPSHKGSGNVKDRGNMWTQGPSASYDCKKMKEQLLCDSVTNCMNMEEGSPEGKLCGWCPGDSTSKVKNSKKLLKYEDNKEGKETKIKGDTCPDLGVADRFGNVWFSELISAGACPECEKANSSGVSTGSNGPHSKECLNSLWQTPFNKDDIRVKCTTNYNDKYAKDIGAEFTNVRKPYYKISSEMKVKLNNKILNFKKDYNDKAKWDILKEYPRRRYDVNEIDTLWKQCFGEDRNGKVKKGEV